MKKMLKVILLISLLFTLFGCKSSDYKNALEEIAGGNYQVAIDSLKGIEDYKDSKAYIEISETMIAIEGNVLKGKELLNNGKKLLNNELLDSLTNAVNAGKQITNSLKENLTTENESFDPTTYLSDNDCINLSNNLGSIVVEFDESQQKYVLVNNPTDAYVIECLETVDEILGIDKVTEDHDPNGKLNKAKGYTAQVYFESSNVDQSEVRGADIIEKGTLAGGSIEVYANEEDALARDQYLSAFDGTFLASGSHKVIGTVIVRTSDLLKASQQKELETKIIDSLTKIK